MHAFGCSPQTLLPLQACPTWVLLGSLLFFYLFCGFPPFIRASDRLAITRAPSRSRHSNFFCLAYLLYLSFLHHATLFSPPFVFFLFLWLVHRLLMSLYPQTFLDEALSPFMGCTYERSTRVSIPAGCCLPFPDCLPQQGSPSSSLLIGVFFFPEWPVLRHRPVLAFLRLLILVLIERKCFSTPVIFFPSNSSVELCTGAFLFSPSIPDTSFFGALFISGYSQILDFFFILPKAPLKL